MERLPIGFCGFMLLIIYNLQPSSRLLVDCDQGWHSCCYLAWVQNSEGETWNLSLMVRIQRSVKPTSAVHVLSVLSLGLDAYAMSVAVGDLFLFRGIEAHWETQRLHHFHFAHVFWNLQWFVTLSLASFLRAFSERYGLPFSAALAIARPRPGSRPWPAVRSGSRPGASTWWGPRPVQQIFCELCVAATQKLHEYHCTNLERRRDRDRDLERLRFGERDLERWRDLDRDLLLQERWKCVDSSASTVWCT